MRFLLGIVTIAMSAVSVLAANSCKVGGLAGTCISTSSCASSGGKSTAGHCPKDPNNVRCCTYGTCKAKDGRSGKCVPTGSCSGTSIAGLCPGPANIKCCVAASAPVPKTCKVSDGRTGKCVKTSSCSGKSIPGFCPGASNIQCCVTAPAPKTCKVSDGRSGKCISTGSCTGTSVPGFCPGASNIQCCVSGKAPPTGSFNAAAVIASARKQIGYPYVWGGGHKSSPGASTGTCVGYTGSIKPCPAEHTVGYDCSGLVRMALYKGAGIDLGRGGNTDNQLADKHSKIISYANRQPGDIEFFGPASNVYHVILYIGKNSAGKDMMIEAQKTGTKVHEVPLRTGGIWVRVR
ncbi:hypothetical protein BGZ76_008039 [Entomortierella beljakovae]|nr:hypothetical protein BGZ76_008039 [Entomortierella beljakovae]